MKFRKLLLVFIFSIMFIPFVVNAETCENDKVSIDSFVIKDISDNVVEKNEPVINGMEIMLDLEMNEVEDSIEYEMMIKNDSNTDYKLSKKSLNIESEYIDYTFETKDKTNTVKAKSSSEAILTIQYRNEVPEELLENGSFTDSKSFNIGLNDGNNTILNILTNPKTGQSLLFIFFIIALGIFSLFASKKNKKITTLILMLGLMSLPFAVYAECELQLKFESNVEIKPIEDSDSIVYIDHNYVLRKNGNLSTYDRSRVSTSEYIEATSENLGEEVIAENVKDFYSRYLITKDNKLYYLDYNNDITLLASDIKKYGGRWSGKFLTEDNEYLEFSGKQLRYSDTNVSSVVSSVSSSNIGIYITDSVFSTLYVSNNKLYYYNDRIGKLDMSEISELNKYFARKKNGKLIGFSGGVELSSNARILDVNGLFVTDDGNLYVGGPQNGIVSLNMKASKIFDDGFREDVGSYRYYNDERLTSLIGQDDNNLLFTLSPNYYSYDNSRINYATGIEGKEIIDIGSMNVGQVRGASYILCDDGVYYTWNSIPMYVWNGYSNWNLNGAEFIPFTNRINESLHLPTFDCDSKKENVISNNTFTDLYNMTKRNDVYNDTNYLFSVEDNKQYVIEEEQTTQQEI